MKRKEHDLPNLHTKKQKDAIEKRIVWILVKHVSLT